MTTEGVRVSWTSTEVERYQVEIGTVFNVKTTTTTTSRLKVFLFLLFFWYPCMAVNVSVQYNDVLLPDIILLTPCDYIVEPF